MRDSADSLSVTRTCMHCALLHYYYTAGISSGQVVASAIPSTQQFRALDIFVIQVQSQFFSFEMIYSSHKDRNHCNHNRYRNAITRSAVIFMRAVSASTCTMQQHTEHCIVSLLFYAVLLCTYQCFVMCRRTRTHCWATLSRWSPACCCWHALGTLHASRKEHKQQPLLRQLQQQSCNCFYHNSVASRRHTSPCGSTLYMHKVLE
jgi:hypothetical protein